MGMRTPSPDPGQSIDRENARPFRPWPRVRRSRRGFSMIEVLSVLAIISVMAAVSFPSLAGMNQSASVTAGGNDVADLATFAHDYALSHNTMTALVAATTPSAIPATDQYRLLIVMANPSGDGLTWLPVSKWHILPDGATLSATTANTFLNNASQAFKVAAPTFKGAVLPNGSYGYKVFFPDGHMDTSAATPPTLRVVSLKNRASASPVDYYDLVFNPTTGAVKISRP